MARLSRGAVKDLACPSICDRCVQGVPDALALTAKTLDQRVVDLIERAGQSELVDLEAEPLHVAGAKGDRGAFEPVRSVGKQFCVAVSARLYYRIELVRCFGNEQIPELAQ
jgi:hypothetical protein